MRFFFDYTTKDRSLYDFQGDEFHSPQSAIEFAEAIAQDLKCSLFNDWLGWWIEVRPDGRFVDNAKRMRPHRLADAQVLVPTLVGE